MANFGDIGAGVSDIFSGFGDIEKMKGDELEAQNYANAAVYAGQEAQYSQMSAAIQEAQGGNGVDRKSRRFVSS